MARLPTGTDVRTEVGVTDASVRVYPFRFALPPDGRGVVVRRNEAVVPPGLYAVSVAADGQSGTVRFYTAGQVPQPQALSVGDVLLIERDTTVEQAVAPGGAGFASAGALRALAGWTLRVLEELTSRTEAHADIILTPDQIATLVAGQVKAFAVTGGPAIADADIAPGTITKERLEAFLQNLADRAILTSGLAVVGQSLVATGADQTSRVEIDIPGLTVEGEGGLLGTASTVITLQFTGSAKPTRTGNKVVVDVTVNADDVDPHVADHPQVVALEAFEAALRRTREIGTYALDQGAIARGAHATGLKVPTLDRDQAIRIVVGGEAPKTFTLASLLGKTRVTTPGTQVDLSSAVPIVDDSNEVIWFAVNDAGDLWAAADSVGTMRQLAVSIDELDLEDFARRSSDARVGPDKLGSGVRDGTKLLRDDGAWVDPPAGGTADGSSLTPLTAFPGSPVVGQVTNLEGELWEYVEDTSEANVFTGAISRQASGDYGDAKLHWGTSDPFNIRAFLSRTALGASPPMDLWLEFHASDGEEASLIRMSRASGSDTATEYAYHKFAGEPGIEATSGTYTVFWYTDAAKTTPQTVHDDDRWEVYTRTGRVPPAGSGGPSAPVGSPTTLTEMVLSAARDVATTNPGEWTAWQTLLTGVALTRASVVALFGSVHGEVTTAPSGGGDRVYLELRLVRTRAAADGTLEDSFAYIRNTGNANVGSAAQRALVNEVSGKFGLPVAIGDDGLVGDVYKLEARVLSQVGARTVQFDTQTKVQIIQVGSGGAYPVATQAQAEDKTDTTPLTFTPERLFQAIEADIHTHRGGTLGIGNTGVFSPAAQGSADRVITEAEFDANSAITFTESPPNTWSGATRANPYVVALPQTRRGQPMFVTNITGEWLYFTTSLEATHRNTSRGRTPNSRGRLLGPGAARWIVVTGNRTLTSFAPEDFDLEVLTAAQYTALADKLDTSLYFVVA